MGIQTYLSESQFLQPHILISSTLPNKPTSILPVTTIMNAAVFALFSLFAIVFDATAIGETYSCQQYAAVGYKGFTCNDRSDVICTEGCNTFVTATKCKLQGYPKKPESTEFCTVGFGQGTFRCTGNYSGVAKCFGCVPSNQISWAK